MDPTLKIEYSEKINIYKDLARKKPVEHNGVVISIEVVVLANVIEGLKKKELGELELRGKNETIQTTALLKFARILRRVLAIWRDFLSLRLQ